MQETRSRRKTETTLFTHHALHAGFGLAGLLCLDGGLLNVAIATADLMLHAHRLGFHSPCGRSNCVRVVWVGCGVLGVEVLDGRAPFFLSLVCVLVGRSLQGLCRIFPLLADIVCPATHWSGVG